MPYVDLPPSRHKNADHVVSRIGMRLVLCERYLNLSLKKIDEFSNAIFVTMSSSSVTISSSSWNTKLACLFRDVYVRHVPRIELGHG